MQRKLEFFSRDEKKQEEMRMLFNDERLKFIIGDIRDYNSIYSATSGVNYIFHAAALNRFLVASFTP